MISWVKKISFLLSSCQIVFNFSFLAPISFWLVCGVSSPEEKKFGCKRCGEARQEINFSSSSYPHVSARGKLRADDFSVYVTFLHVQLTKWWHKSHHRCIHKKDIFAFWLYEIFAVSPSGDVQHISLNICCVTFPWYANFSLCSNDDSRMLFDVLIELLFRVSIFIAVFPHSQHDMGSAKNGASGNRIHFIYSLNWLRASKKP